jgi:hypothetical protein
LKIKKGLPATRVIPELAADDADDADENKKSLSASSALSAA